MNCDSSTTVTDTEGAFNSTHCCWNVRTGYHEPVYLKGLTLLLALNVTSDKYCFLNSFKSILI